jgi:hypothetical protein
VVTGGGAVVKAAMTCGKRAIAAGPGNPPVVVDETADIAKAARDIVFGASLDNNIICIVEKEVIAVADIADRLKKEMKANKAVEITGQDLKRFEKLLITPDNHVNRDYIGKDAAVILRDAGIRVPDDTRLGFAEVDEKHPFVQHEMLLPVSGLVRVPDADSAIACAKRCEHGYGHTAVIHSNNVNTLAKYARTMNTSITVKKRPERRGHGPWRRGLHVLDHCESDRRRHDLRPALRAGAPVRPQGRLPHRLMAYEPALGLLELCSIARGIVCCDAVVKKAQVRLVHAGSTHPGKYTILIRGGVDEVIEALARARPWPATR